MCGHFRNFCSGYLHVTCVESCLTMSPTVFDHRLGSLAAIKIAACFGVINHSRGRPPLRVMGRTTSYRLSWPGHSPSSDTKPSWQTLQSWMASHSLQNSPQSWQRPGANSEQISTVSCRLPYHTIQYNGIGPFSTRRILSHATVKIRVSQFSCPPKALLFSLTLDVVKGTTLYCKSSTKYTSAAPDRKSQLCSACTAAARKS